METRKMPENPPACPKCDATCTVAAGSGPQWRCQQCGNCFGQRKTGIRSVGGSGGRNQNVKLRPVTLMGVIRCHWRGSIPNSSGFPRSCETSAKLARMRSAAWAALRDELDVSRRTRVAHCCIEYNRAVTVLREWDERLEAVQAHSKRNSDMETVREQNQWSATHSARS